MSLNELIGAIGTNCDKCEVADKEGRPEQMRSRLCHIVELIQQFLGTPDVVNEKQEEKEETSQTPGHCQPDQTHKESSE